MMRRNFLWPAILGGYPSGRHCVAPKIALGNFWQCFSLAVALSCAMGASHAQDGPVTTAVDRFMNAHSQKLVRQLGANTRVEHTIAIPESQLVVTACTAPLQLSARDAGQISSRVTVEVTCSNAWSVLVPVDVAIFKPVVAATRPLATGNIIEADDVQLIDSDITRLAGQYLTRLDEVVGMSVKRPLAQGRAMTASQLAQPLMIRRGDGVVINAETSSIAVKMSGTALSDGR